MSKTENNKARLVYDMFIDMTVNEAYASDDEKRNVYKRYRLLSKNPIGRDDFDKSRLSDLFTRDYLKSLHSIWEANRIAQEGTMTQQGLFTTPAQLPVGTIVELNTQEKDMAEVVDGFGGRGLTYKVGHGRNRTDCTSNHALFYWNGSHYVEAPQALINAIIEIWVAEHKTTAPETLKNFYNQGGGDLVERYLPTNNGE